MFGVARVSFKLERGTPFFVPAWKGSPHITRTTHTYADTQTHPYADPHTHRRTHSYIHTHIDTHTQGRHRPATSSEPHEEKQNLAETKRRFHEKCFTAAAAAAAASVERLSKMKKDSSEVEESSSFFVFLKTEMKKVGTFQT